MLPQKPLSLTKPRGISFHLLHQITLMYIGFLRPFPFFFFNSCTSSQNICMPFISFLFPSPTVYLFKHSQQAASLGSLILLMSFFHSMLVFSPVFVWQMISFSCYRLVFFLVCFLLKKILLADANL